MIKTGVSTRTSFRSSFAGSHLRYLRRSAGQRKRVETCFLSNFSMSGLPIQSSEEPKFSFPSTFFDTLFHGNVPFCLPVRLPDPTLGSARELTLASARDDFFLFSRRIWKRILSSVWSVSNL